MLFPFPPSLDYYVFRHSKVLKDFRQKEVQVLEPVMIPYEMFLLHQEEVCIQLAVLILIFAEDFLTSFEDSLTFEDLKTFSMDLDLDLEGFEVLCDVVITEEVLFVLFWEVENDLCIVLEVNTSTFCKHVEVTGHIDLEVGLYGGDDKEGVILI